MNSTPASSTFITTPAEITTSRLAGWQFWYESGALDTDARPSRDGAILVLYCEDIDAKLGEIEKAGGKTVKGKTQIPGHGAHYAYFEDPAGNRMGLYAPAK